MAVTLVNATMAAEGSGTSATTTIPSTTAGNTIVVVIGLYGQGGGAVEIDMATSSPCVDNQSNGYSPIAAAEVKRTATTWYQHQYFYIATGTTGAVTTVTTAFSGGTFYFVTVYELTPATFDQATNATGSGSTAVNAGTLTPPANGAFAVMQSLDEASTSFTPSSGWTMDRDDTAGGGTTFNAHLAQATAAAINFTATGPASGPQQWSAAGITLVPPGGAAAITASAGATGHVTATVTAASLISPTAGATATVTASETAASRIAFSAGATATVTASVTAASLISAGAGATATVTATVSFPSAALITASIGAKASMFAAVGPIAAVTNVQYAIAAMRIDQFNGTSPAGASLPHALVTDFEGVQRNFEQFQQPGIFVGTGAPTFPAQAGNFYHRTDTPTIANQRIYVFTGSAWTGIV